MVMMQSSVERLFEENDGYKEIGTEKEEFAQKKEVIKMTGRDSGALPGRICHKLETIVTAQP